MNSSEHKEREHFFGAAKVIAALTLLSRVFGLVRDMTIIWLGARWRNDAFQVAFFLPNLFRRLFGEGALSAAFVPVLTETTETAGMDKARRLLANAMALLAIFLLTVMVLMQVGLLIWLALSPPDRPDRQFLVLLSSIMLPFMVTVCLLALASSALNCRGHFVYPAAAPIILNVCMISADLVAYVFWRGDTTAQLTTVAASVTVAGVIQLLGVLWMLRRTGFSIRLRLRPIEPGIRKMLRLMAPALLGMGFLQLSSLFDYLAMLFFSANPFAGTISFWGHSIQRPLAEGSVVQWVAATRIGQFPLGVFAISLGVAVFPLLSRYAHRGDMPNLRQSLNRAIRLSIMEGLATGVGLFVLADPIVNLLFRHQEFSAANAAGAVHILRLYVLGMWAYCSHQIFSRAFYSLKDPKTPMRVSSALAVVYMVLVSTLIWIPSLNAGAFGLVPSISFTLNVTILAICLRRKVGRFGGRKVALSAARSLASAGTMALALTFLQCELTGQDFWIIPHVLGISPHLGYIHIDCINWIIDCINMIIPRALGLLPYLHRAPTPNWAVVLVCVPVGAVVFVLTAWLLRAPELKELVGSFRKSSHDADEGPAQA